MGPNGVRFLRLVTARTEALDLAGFQRDLARRRTLAGQWSAFLADRPLLSTPTSTRPPFVVGEDCRGPAEEAGVGEAHRMLMTVNLFGLASVAVPVGLGEHGPLNVQLTGPHYVDELWLDAAAHIEARLGRLTPIDPKG